MFHQSTNLLLLFTVFILWAGCSAVQTEKEILYIASGDGLVVLEFDRNAREFHPIQTVTERTGGFHWIHPNGEFLYSITGRVNPNSDHGGVAAYRIDQQSGELTFLNIQSTGGRGPAHVSVDPLGRFVYVSNYGGGSVSSFAIRDDGTLSEAVSVIQHEGSSINERRQDKPYAHSTIPSPDGRFVYTSDLGTDKINIYAVDQQTGALSPAEVPWVEVEPGSGPRHFRFHPEKPYAYSVDELSSTVTVMSFNSTNGALEVIQRVDMIPEWWNGVSYSADIHISPDGQFLYASNRGHDSLAIYRILENGHLELLGHEPTRGGHPRNFGIDAHGEYVFVLNRDSDNNLVLFERDQQTGMLSFTGVQMRIPRAICVTQKFL